MYIHPKHDGVDIHFDGKISTQKLLPMSDSFPTSTASKPTVLIGERGDYVALCVFTVM